MRLLAHATYQEPAESMPIEDLLAVDASVLTPFLEVPAFLSLYSTPRRLICWYNDGPKDEQRPRLSAQRQPSLESLVTEPLPSSQILPPAPQPLVRHPSLRFTASTNLIVGAHPRVYNVPRNDAAILFFS